MGVAKKMGPLFLQDSVRVRGAAGASQQEGQAASVSAPLTPLGDAGS